MVRKVRAPGTFGTIETLPSKRHRARYRGPDGRRYTAPTLFLAKADARGWLALRQAEIIRNAWTPPGADEQPAQRQTFTAYAETWLAERDLKDRTREHYRKLLDAHLLPAFGALPLASITADDVRTWYAKMGKDTPTLRSHCYGLLRTIMGVAVSDGKTSLNPCVIRGAGTTKRVHKIRPANPSEVAIIAAEMPEKYRAMVMLAAWCALRFGELTELRRSDIVIAADDAQGDEVGEKFGVVRVERGVVRTKSGFLTGSPKSDAGIRDVAIPAALLPIVERHLAKFVAADDGALVFAASHGGHLAPATLYRHYYPAREAAGLPTLRFHDLRHSGAVFAALTGATLAELMGRLGHSTPSAAMRYQHAAQGRDRQIAASLSKLVVEIG